MMVPVLSHQGLGVTCCCSVTGIDYKIMMEGINLNLGEALSVVEAVGVSFGFSLPCWCAHLLDPMSGDHCPLLENCPGPDGSHLTREVSFPLGSSLPAAD